MKRNSGFTLIELMIVVAIISVIIIIGIPSMLRSRMVANEVSAIASCKALASGQEIYRRADRNGDGVLEYATAMGGNNSLLETKVGLGDLGIIDIWLATAEGQPGVAIGKNGYVFTVLTQQGSAGQGGPYSYVGPNGVGGYAMVKGYAMGGVPTGYDLSGRMSFLIGQTGTVYQKDRGTTGTQETWFNPDQTTSPAWAPVD
jgi:prepilin-type N-terminal cleavage/methylation domain-containing protein